MDLGAFHPAYFTWPEVILRLGGALILSLALGIERFLRRKPIDFRPFVIICRDEPQDRLAPGKPRRTGSGTWGLFRGHANAGKEF